MKVSELIEILMGEDEDDRVVIDTGFGTGEIADIITSEEGLVMLTNNEYNNKPNKE